MELKIKTTTLQDMVGKSAKCVSNNKLIPITSLINIKVKSNVFTLTTTDATHYFYVKSDEKFDCEDFEVSVLADIFIKLVQKSTSEYITMSVDGNVFKVNGNGTYKIEMPLDENGGIIKFPQKLPGMEPPVTGNIKLSTVNFLLNYNKQSLAASMEIPSITCYYCGDKVVTSDSNLACVSDIKVFDKPQLISPQLMELLGVMSEETINFFISEEDIIFWDKTETAYAPIVKGIETFPITALLNLVNGEFVSKCVVSKDAILSVLDRISLFIGQYDNKGVYFTFTKDGLMVTSKASSGTEIIPYVSSENFTDFTCKVNVEMLKSQINTHEEEKIELSYGAKVALKLTAKNVAQIVALMQDDRGV